MIPRGVLLHRDMACRACEAPCALRDAHAASCDACPLPTPHWGQWDCVAGDVSKPVPAKLGDRFAFEIERRVLTPAEAYAPKIVATIRRCGGCKADQRALNGGGALPGEGLPPPLI